MGGFDAIIGYEGIKKELERTADILRNAKVYREAGAKVPAGLLLHGAPGVGKTLMAESLIRESGLPVFTVRKDKPDGAFMDSLRKAFDDAAMDPMSLSIVYLDDMDKFANADAGHRNAEEYVAVQACMDDVRGRGVFVLATTNDLSCLPSSLLRAGRFDKKLHVKVPTGEEAELIIKHYLADKQLGSDIEMRDIVMLMYGNSCAELESILNEARLIAISERSDVIGRAHFMEAFIEQQVNSPERGEGRFSVVTMDPEERRMASVHEAGHAAIYEILLDEPATSLASAFARHDKCGGVTFCYWPPSVAARRWNEVRILGGLGGKAAVDLVYGICDAGASDDLSRVLNMIFNNITRIGSVGLDKLSGIRVPDGSSDLAAWQEAAIASELARLYQKAKQILAANREFLDKLADAIFVNDCLLASDIQAIKADCTITRFPLSA